MPLLTNRTPLTFDVSSQGATNWFQNIFRVSANYTSVSRSPTQVVFKGSAYSLFQDWTVTVLPVSGFIQTQNGLNFTGNVRAVELRDPTGALVSVLSDFFTSTNFKDYVETQSAFGLGLWDVYTDFSGSNAADVFTGGRGDDIIDGGAGDDVLNGSFGVDLIEGGTGADTLKGGNGDDYLDGGEGDDLIDGEVGFDTVDFSLSRTGVTVNLSLTGPQDTGYGLDTLISIANLVGSDAADTLTGDVYANKIYGGAGGDLLSGGDGGDTLDGEAGDDVIIGGDGDDTLIGGDGADTFVGGAGADNLTGGVGADTFRYLAVGGQGVDTISDFQTGVDKIDLLALGEATATIGTEGSFTKVVVTTAGGTLEILVAGAVASADLMIVSPSHVQNGTPGADVLVGGGGPDTLNGGAGDDQLIGGAGADTLNGDDGVDTADYSASTTAVAVNLLLQTAGGGDAAGDVLSSIENLIGSARNDTFSGDGGANALFGGDGADVVHGDAGNDVLVGNAQVFVQEADQLFGDAGDDLIYGENVDQIDGGTGFDSLIAVNAYNFVLNMATTSIEYAVMDFGNDTITAANQTAAVSVFASGGNDNVTGSAFDDLLFGGVGDDGVTGGLGNDALVGEAGVDRLDGGAGDDRLYFEAQDILVQGGSGYDAGYITVGAGGGAAVNAATASLEFLQDLAGQSDVITAAGANAALTAYAGGGDDTVDGSLFADVFWGEAGDDALSGSQGDDVLVGGQGSDRLVGGAGNDALFGNGGSGGDGARDVFVFTQSTAANADAVYDFEHGVDKLDFSAFPASFASVSIADAGGSAVVYCNGELICTVVGVAAATLTAGDFVFSSPETGGPQAAAPLSGGGGFSDATGMMGPDVFAAAAAVWAPVGHMPALFDGACLA